MFVDASAIVAVLNQEPGWEEIAQLMADSPSVLLASPLVRFEAVLALARAASHDGSVQKRSDAAVIAAARDLVDDFLLEIGARDVPITREIGEAALQAAATYGKVVGHPAALNFGDCFSHACAKAHGTALLYKGDDFGRTDLA